MAFTLRIETGNAAFKDGQRKHEVTRILREIAQQIEDQPCAKISTIHDANGEAVGAWRFTARD
jgi:hypothetical protein